MHSVLREKQEINGDPSMIQQMRPRLISLLQMSGLTWISMEKCTAPQE